MIRESTGSYPSPAPEPLSVRAMIRVNGNVTLSEPFPWSYRFFLVLTVCSLLAVPEAQADEAHRPSPTDRNHPPPLTLLRMEIINYASTFLMLRIYLPTSDYKKTKDNTHQCIPNQKKVQIE